MHAQQIAVIICHSAADLALDTLYLRGHLTVKIQALHKERMCMSGVWFH